MANDDDVPARLAEQMLLDANRWREPFSERAVVHAPQSVRVAFTFASPPRDDLEMIVARIREDVGRSERRAGAVALLATAAVEISAPDVITILATGVTERQAAIAALRDAVYRATGSSGVILAQELETDSDGSIHCVPGLI